MSKNKSPESSPAANLSSEPMSKGHNNRSKEDQHEIISSSPECPSEDQETINGKNKTQTEKDDAYADDDMYEKSGMSVEEEDASNDDGFM